MELILYNIFKQSYKPDMCSEIDIDISSGANIETIIWAISATFEMEKTKIHRDYFADLKQRIGGLKFIFGKLMESDIRTIFNSIDGVSVELRELVQIEKHSVFECSRIMKKMRLTKETLLKMFADVALHVEVNCVDDIPQISPKFFNNIMERCKRRFTSRIDSFDAAVPALETIKSNMTRNEYVDELCDANGLDFYSTQCLQLVVFRLNSEMSEAIRQYREVRS